MPYTALPDVSSNMPTDHEFQALNEPSAAEKAVVDLLRICLERIDGQEELCEWQNRLLQALDRLQSALISEKETPSMRITGYQMDCLAGLCQAASAGEEAQTLLSAFALCDAFMPFNQWVEEGVLTGKHDKLTELARRHPETHALLVASTTRIPLQELERHLKAWELGDWGETMKTDVGNTDRFRMYLKHRDALFREWIGLFSSKNPILPIVATYHQQI
jgi:hypothetical protein